MSDEELVRIKNIRTMARCIGKDVAREMLIPIKEMKFYIKPKEIVSIIKQYSLHKNNDFLIDTMILQKIMTEVKNWVMGIQLAKMASDGKMDVIWDDEQNCMIFKSI